MIINERKTKKKQNKINKYFYSLSNFRIDKNKKHKINKLNLK